MAEAILKVENLSKSFPSKNGTDDVVRNLSFEVKRGEIFGFLGPNGAGKTTTIKMLTTQLRPTDGNVTLADQPIWEKLVDTRRRISVVTQHNNLDRGLTARENLLFHARYFNLPQKEAEKRAGHFLDIMGLSKRADDRVAILHEGHLKALDSPEELKKRVPGKNVVSIRTGEISEDLVSKAKDLPEVEDVRAEMGTLRFYMKDAAPDMSELVGWLNNKGINILSLNLHVSTLNDVFVHLTGRGLEQR